MIPQLASPGWARPAVRGPRTFIIGDVHACAAELEELLGRLAPGRGDRVIFVGDLVDRGPAVRRVFDLAREARGELVRGNHEDKLLRWRSGRPGARGVTVQLAPHHFETVEQLRPEDWQLMESAKPFLEVPDHGVVVVHAGLRPGIPLKEQDPDDLCRLQSIGPSGRRRKSGTPGARFWAETCDLPGWVVYGHTHMRVPLRFERTLGIDTGCCFGGHLTALELPSGALHQVRAARNYAAELYARFYGSRRAEPGSTGGARGGS